jgi:PAS domain S-box-containing protein
VLVQTVTLLAYLNESGVSAASAAAAGAALRGLLGDLPEGPVLATFDWETGIGARLAVAFLSRRLACRTRSVALALAPGTTAAVDVRRTQAQQTFLAMQLGCWIEKHAQRVAAQAIVASHAGVAGGTAPFVNPRDLGSGLATLGLALRCGIPELWQRDFRWSWSMLRARGYDPAVLRATWRAVWSIVAQRLPRALKTLVPPLAASLDDVDGALDEPSFIAGAHADALFRAFEQRRAPRAVVAGLRTAGVAPDRLFVDCLTPVQRESGRLWQYGRMSVAEEHRRTAIVTALIYEAALPDRARPVGGSLLLAAAPGDQHDIGLKMIAQLARLDGWDVALPDCPQTEEQIYVAILDRRPDVVALSASLTAGVCALVALIARLRSDPRCAGTKIVAGGAPFVAFPQLAHVIGADATAPDAAAAVRLLSGLRANRRPVPLGGSPESLNASTLETVVRAGSWTYQHASGTCSWSPGLYALLEIEPATLAPSYAALAELIEPGDRPAVLDAWAAAHAEREPFELTFRMRLPNGLTKIVLQRAQTTYGSRGNPIETAGMLIDITKEQLTRRKLDAATAKLMAIWEHVPEALALVDANDGALVEVNPQAEAVLGETQAELAGQPFESFVPGVRRTSKQPPARDVRSVLRTGVPIELSTSAAFRVGPRELTLASFRDISRRKQLEERAALLAATLAVMVRANAAIVRGVSGDDLLRLVCNAIVGERYVAALVAEPGAPNATARIVATAGPRRYFENLAFGWNPQESSGRGPFGEAVRCGRSVGALVTEPIFAPWRERALAAGIRAVLALPIRNTPGGPVMIVYLGDDRGFRPNEIALFESLADDIALGLRALRERDLHDRAVSAERTRAEELELALTGALAAVGATLEQRDPYTAGHEQRVRDLCRSIAGEIGLDADRTRGLCLAASVHDIGKIAIPAEILTKPTRLSAIEFAFVREHPQTGYDILRNIPFRWPIAEIVLQHHEYLDGTGYPRGLTGEQILLEARILTVADIADSMSAFRSFHRAFGMDTVIAELTRLAGTRLDADVVAGCFRILERGDFRPAAGARPSPA